MEEDIPTHLIIGISKAILVYATLNADANEAEVDLKCIFVPHFAQLKELVLCTMVFK